MNMTKQEIIAESRKTVRNLSVLEFAKLQTRYAYAHELNNYEQLPFDQYQEWYKNAVKFVDWSKFEENGEA